MEQFGLSLTAMRYHLWNALGRSFDVQGIFSDADPTDEWRGREQYADDYFPIESTPQTRRGVFAGVVVRAQRLRWISEDTAAHYLNTDNQTYLKHQQDIAELYPEIQN